MLPDAAIIAVIMVCVVAFLFLCYLVNRYSTPAAVADEEMVQQRRDDDQQDDDQQDQNQHDEDQQDDDQQDEDQHDGDQQGDEDQQDGDQPPPPPNQQDGNLPPQLDMLLGSLGSSSLEGSSRSSLLATAVKVGGTFLGYYNHAPPTIYEAAMTGKLNAESADDLYAGKKAAVDDDTIASGQQSLVSWGISKDMNCVDEKVARRRRFPNVYAM
ncbi:hypothetical protein PIB30_099598 [Stylosanthes scabra]|uniref:Uncharacterized protein n=1 Tax=Stylosanthes scabra TaxID=79078 RepID=A0ABU6TXR8_9FABA|nr:hypothetical protein [Stylosanthes scabra]